MSTRIRVERGDADETVDSVLALQVTEGICSGDFKGDRLESGDFPLLRRLML